MVLMQHKIIVAEWSPSCTAVLHLLLFEQLCNVYDKVWFLLICCCFVCLHMAATLMPLFPPSACSCGDYTHGCQNLTLSVFPINCFIFLCVNGMDLVLWFIQYKLRFQVYALLIFLDRLIRKSGVRGFFARYSVNMIMVKIFLVAHVFAAFFFCFTNYFSV